MCVPTNMTILSFLSFLAIMAPAAAFSVRIAAGVINKIPHAVWSSPLEQHSQMHCDVHYLGMYCIVVSVVFVATLLRNLGFH